MSAAAKEAVDATFDITAITAHIENLHSLAKGVDGKFVVFTLMSERPGPITHHRVGDVAGMVTSVISHEGTPGANVYTGLHVMRPNLDRNERGGKADIVAVLGLVADMDADTDNIGDMPVAPSYIVESSPGNSQPAILFDEPVAPDVATPLAIALGNATGSDSGTKDIAKVWRIPGTLNWPCDTKIKRGRSPDAVAVRYIEPFSGVVYTTGALASTLAPYAKPATTSNEHVPFAGTVDTAPLWERISETARAKLKSDGKPDRSAHALRVVEQFDFDGFTLDEAVSLCLERPGDWTRYRRSDERLVGDIQRLWSKYILPKQAKRAEDAAAAERVIPTAANDNAKTDSDRLPVIDPRDWDGLAVPERDWFVHGFIPSRTVTSMSGEGGSGKTELALQLLAASALRTNWFGKHVAEGPCLYFGAEDEAAELHRRLARIVEHAEGRLADLDGVRLIPMAELDAVLAEPDKSGRMLATHVFRKLKTEALLLCPKLTIIDPSADVFGGDEINRAQVRKFVSMLRGMAIELDCAVLLLSHPSLTGINTGTGSSGSTAWHNSVRSRLYLEVPKTDGVPDPSARLLRVVKANYGPTGEVIPVRWHDGVYVLDGGPDPIVGNLLDRKAEELFIELLILFTEQEQNCCVATGASYAPAKMVKHPKAKGFNRRQLAAAMQRLLDAKRIKNETFGSSSRKRNRLVVVDKGAGQ